MTKIARELNFEKYMWFVDQHIFRITMGLTHSDLADQLWMDMFLNGVSPKEAAEQALENEGFFSFVDGQ